MPSDTNHRVPGLLMGANDTDRHPQSAPTLPSPRRNHSRIVQTHPPHLSQPTPMVAALTPERPAHAVLVASNRDDASVLICLTVRSLAPRVHLVASAREEENIKLLYGAGADLVVSPSVSGGRLMGAAVRQQVVPQFLEDLLSFGDGLALSERIVRLGEAGKTAAELPDLRGALILGAARGQKRFAFHQLPGMRLQPGDVVV